ncbi:putative calcineurin-like phosphoesterase [Trichoderma austrokoningii]
MNTLSKIFSKRAKSTQQPPGARIQILSDLHLEVGQQYSSYTFPASAPILLLGGDIGRMIDFEGYLKFLEAQACRFEQILLVLGNHEFYGMDHAAGVEKARLLTQQPSLDNKVILLHRARWNDPGSPLTILGCTLWSHILEDSSSIVEYKISDFHKINDWTVQKHNQLHSEDVTWLRDQVLLISSQNTGIEVDNRRRILMATHHAPCLDGTSRPDQTTNPWTCAFATELIAGQECWNDVRVWVFGHTHYTTDFICNGIRLVSNQRGYVLPGSLGAVEKNKKASGEDHDFNARKLVHL